MSNSNGLILVGAGGHAKVSLEVLNAIGIKVDYCVAGLDSADNCLGIQVLKGDDGEILKYLKSRGYEKIFIAIGSNSLRKKISIMACEIGFSPVTAISPNAVLSPTAKVGVGALIMPGAVINASSEIGNYSIINTGSTVDHDGIIGDFAHVAPQCALAGSVHVGDSSFLGIGVQCIPDTRIGAASIIGAGSLVTRNMPSKVLAYGRPAKIVKYL